MTRPDSRDEDDKGTYERLLAMWIREKVKDLRREVKHNRERKSYPAHEEVCRAYADRLERAIAALESETP